MDRNFDFSALLTQTHENKHKFKPSQFRSVAGGVKKRLDSNIENKRRTRLTNFDSFRNIPVCQTPEPKPLTKIEQRMLQLKKWKEEKAKKKAEAMAKKKKPFVVGVAKDTLQFGPPPPVVFPLPSTSGRVTRSQNQKLYNFAPQNAVFNPKLQNLDIPKSLNNAPKSLNNASKSLNNAPKSLNNTRSLRSKKLTEVSSAVENATIPKIQVARKPSKPTKSKLISNSTSSSGSTDSHHNGSKPVTKVTISAKKMRNTKKGKISASTTKKRRISKIVPSTSNDKLVDLSNSTSMEIEVKKALNSSKMFIPNTEETPNKLQQIIQDFITFTPKNPVPKSESSSEEKLRSPKVIDVPMTPQEIQEEVKMISPRVCLSRGKDNTRKEMKKKIADGLLDEDICDMSVGHFRRQLNSEITRMTEMCEVWDNTLEQETVPDEIQEAVQSAVGQARLLMSQKLQQFASLMRRCEQPEPGQMLVNRTDLQGFWDMVFLQIDDVDIRFKKLEQSRARGWSAEGPAATAALKKKPPQPKPAQSKPAARAPTAANSRLKDIIAAARKAKQAKPDATKTFEAGFFRIQSPVKSPAAAAPAATPARQPSMLQSVLSCEAQKASCKQASYAMLRASLLAKSVDGDPSYEANLVPSTPINLGLTPGKSILKCNNNSSMKVASKQLQFMLASSASSVSSDATSESGPAADHGQISGVEKLPDMDSSQNSSPAQLKNSQIQNLANSDAEDNSHISAEGRRNRRSSRRSVKPNVEDNLLTDSGNSTEGKRNRRSSRSSVKPNAEDLLTDSENIQEETKNKRSSRRSVRSNVEDVMVSKDSEKIAEDKENKHSSRSSARSKHEDNLLATDSENYAEETKNRRSSRRSVTPNVEDNLVSTDSKKFADGKENIVSSRRSARLKRQDAVEIVTPRSTRSRRKAV